jgi:hypothetical protein
MFFDEIVIQAKSYAPMGREMAEKGDFLWLYHRLISGAPPAHKGLRLIFQTLLACLRQPKGWTLNFLPTLLTDYLPL